MANTSLKRKKKPRSFTRGLKKFSLWFFGIIIFILLFILFGSSFFSERIGKAVVTELNKGLKHGIEIDDYELSLVKYFPNAAVSLKDVRVPDANNDKTLLEAEELAFRFGLFSLFGSSIDINSVVVNNGAMYVETDAAGRSNTDIMKPTQDTTSSGDMNLNIKLEKAKLQNIELIYEDQRARQSLSMNLMEANMAGEFSGERFVLNSDAKFKTDFFETEDGRYLSGKNISYKADVDVDLKNENYKLKDVLLNVEENKFGVAGEVLKKDNGLYYDLAFDGKDCTLQSLIGLLPEGYVENLVGLQSKGDFKFEGTVKGKSGRQQPAINVTLGLTDGKISGPQLKAPFKDLTFTADFTNGQARTNRSSVLEIKNFKGYLDREMVELNAKVENLDRPYVDVSFDGALSLDALEGFFTSDLITDADGDLEVNNFEIHGLYEEMVNPDLVYRVKTQGEIEFDDAMIQVNKEKITLDKGTIAIADNNVTVSNVEVEGLGSEIKLQGHFENLIPVLLSDSINSKDAKLIFQASLEADKLNIERFVNLSGVPSEGEVKEEVRDSLKTEQIARRESLSNFLEGTFNCNIKQFRYGKISGSDFVGDLKVRNNQLALDGGVKAMDGKFDLEAIAFLKDEPELNAKLLCRDVDVTAFFEQTDNFGQDVLTGENLKGRIDANIAIDAFWDSKGELLMDKLHVITDTNIKKGELINFKMLEDFSAFVKLKDLRHIYFTNTRNWLEVKNQVLHIPVMLVQSNALNLTLSGTHTFEQDIDYNIKVNAGQVVSKKLFKKAGRKPIKAKNGWFNLYYTIKGNIDDFEMDNAKREVKRDFENSEEEKKRIQEQLDQKFGAIGRLTEEVRQDDSDDVDDGYDD